MEVRIDNEKFLLTPKQRRKLRIFEDISTITINRPYNSTELFRLFSAYEKGRHGWDKEFTNDDINQTFVALGNNNALLFTAVKDDKIIAAAFVDKDDQGNIHGDVLFYGLSDGIKKISPGISMLLYIASWAKEKYPKGKFYLGSWNPGPNLSYKSRFRGLEYFHGGRWHKEPPVHKLQSTPSCTNV